MIAVLMSSAVDDAVAQNQTVYVQPSNNALEVEQYTDSTQQYYHRTKSASTSPVRAWVGKQTGALGEEKNTYRMIYGFDLSAIPKHSEIVSVDLVVTITFTSNAASPEYGFHIRSFPGNPSGNTASENWNYIDQGSQLASFLGIPAITEFRNHNIATYNASHVFSQYIEDGFGEMCLLSIKSDDESWGSGDPTVHMMDFKNNATPVISPGEALVLQITYKPYYQASFRNAVDFSGPTWDFRIDGVYRSHPHDEVWEPGDPHDLLMNSHGQINHPVDNRPYNRVPEKWTMQTNSGFNENTGAEWLGMTITEDAIFKAHHFREVDNQFLTVMEGTGVDLSGIPFEVDGQSWSSGTIKTTHDGDDFGYSVVLPFATLDASTGKWLYMVNWVDDTYGQWNATDGTITEEIIPDLHHKVAYDNAYTAEYQSFTFYELETGQELTIHPSSINIDNSTHELTFELPLMTMYNGITCYFIGWEDATDAGTIDYQQGTVTKVMLLGNDDYDYQNAMTGYYKAHLLSTADFSSVVSVCATCPNSQRKIDWIEAQPGMPHSPDGIYQVVYESSERIWYSESIDHAATWLPETFVGFGKHPTIANTSRETYLTYFSGGEIITRKYRNRVWSDITMVLPPPLQAAANSAPAMAIDSVDNVVLLVWEAQSGELAYTIYVDDMIADNGTVPNTGTYGTPVRPSLAHAQGAQTYHLSWREEQAIRYQRIKIDVYGSIWHATLFDGIKTISNATHFAQGAPSITIGKNGFPAVAWGSYDSPHGEFLSFRQNSFGGWGTMATMIAEPNVRYWAPSVASLTDYNVGDDLRIAHNADIGLAVQILQSGSWLVPTSYPPLEGLHPNTVDIVPSAYSHEVYAEYTTLFQQSAKLVSFSDYYLDKTSRNTMESSRELVLIHDTTRAEIRLGELRIGTLHADIDLGWRTGFDTLVVGKTKPVEEYLRTATFTVPVSGVLKYRSTHRKNGMQSMPSNPALVYELVDATTDRSLAALQQYSINGIGQNRVDGNYTLSIHVHAGQDVYIRGSVAGLDSTVELLAIDYYHNPGTALPRFPDALTDRDEHLQDISLSEIYPNPFNPSAHVKFSLQQPTSILLVVHDIHGRPVRVLAEGEYGAGTHTIHFDATGLPSGMYVCTLSAEGLTISENMHLIR